MKNEIIKHFAFPEEFPTVTTGILILEKNMLITGHENGFIVQWETNTGNHKILHECKSSVTAISKSPNDRVLVGCHSGYLFYFSLSDPDQKTTLQNAKDTIASRIWRTVWPDENNLITTSTYGGLYLNQKENSEWKSSLLSGHSHSIFGIANQNDKFFASGDYRGYVNIWKKNSDLYENVDRLKIQGKVEGISWIRENSFATIDDLGHINLIELEQDTNQWKSVFEADIATSSGTCIHSTEDGKSVFAGSYTEIIQFEPDSQQLQIFNIKCSKQIFSKNNTIYVLTKGGLFSFERSEIEIPLTLVKYQYAKISLIGHTGVGKSTLCSIVVQDSNNDIRSTFGKKIWTWTIQKSDENSPERRIVFHDHGGQQTVLGTFLPFLTDSDVVLIFFKQTDRSTFEKAEEILDELKSITNTRTKIFFVQTHIDQELNEIDESKVKHLIETDQIVNCFKISPPKNLGLDEFEKELVNAISWSSPKTLAQSKSVEGIIQTISELEERNSSVVSFLEFKNIYKEIMNYDITTTHLKFLLNNLSSQGLIEYYPEVLDSIIFNDENYNELRSKIPMHVDNKKGLVTMSELQKEFGDSTYLQILDKVYLKYEIAIQDGDSRIFPDRLKHDGIIIYEPFKSFFKNPIYKDEMQFSSQHLDRGNIIKSLIELKLHCVYASYNEAVFAWENNACVYYKIEDGGGDAITGRTVKITYYVGGKQKNICDRLNKEFLDISKRLLGPIVATDDTIKKKLTKKEFDVALSFAGEQREYVEEVANILASKGIKVFYDEFFKSHLWGKDLAVYLQEVYYSKSEWCIMFLSKQYVEKAWPTHERKSALARDVEVRGGYILPVKFDDIEIPGLQHTVSYQNAKAQSPQEIAQLFLEKLKKNN